MRKLVSGDPTLAIISQAPPVLPKLAQVLTRRRLGILEANLFHEATDAKEECFPLGGCPFFQKLQWLTLAKNKERLLVVSIAECLGKGLVNGLFSAMGGNCTVQALRLSLK
jgi:hypothetical protein